MADHKKSPSRKPGSKHPTGAAPDQDRLSKLLKSLTEWYLTKVNGDPATEGFDLLMTTDGPDGGTMCKYVLGDFDESKARLKADLETIHTGIDMYAYAYRGYWQTPEGLHYDGAIVIIESIELPPTVLGLEIAPAPSGRRDIVGEMHRMGVGDWSLFHRSRKS